MARDTRQSQDTENVTTDAGVVHRPDGLKHLSPERAAAFLGLVRAGNALANSLDAELEVEHGISLRGFEVLLFLAVFSSEGSLRMSELTERAPLSQSRVSRLVDQLERRGFVKRSPAESDGRGVTVTITGQGVQKFKAAQETHLSSLERRLFAHLNRTEIRQLAAITRKILEASQV